MTRDSGLLRFGLLGLTEVHYDDGPPEAPRRQRLSFEGKQPLKILTVLLILSLREEPIKSTDLATLLGTTPQTLSNSISALNKVFSSAGFRAPVTKTAEGRLIELDARQLDVNRFEDQVTAAEKAVARDEPEIALQCADDALSWWHGDEPMASIDCTEITEPAARRLKNRRWEARELECDLNLGLGRPEPARRALQILAEDDSLNERVHKKLMVAEYRCGHPSAALKVYRDYRKRLAEAEGIDPGAGIDDGYRRILNGDEDLRRPDAEF